MNMISTAELFDKAIITCIQTFNKNNIKSIFQAY